MYHLSNILFNLNLIYLKLIFPKVLKLCWNCFYWIHSVVLLSRAVVYRWSQAQTCKFTKKELHCSFIKEPLQTRLWALSRMGLKITKMLIGKPNASAPVQLNLFRFSFNLSKPRIYYWVELTTHQSLQNNPRFGKCWCFRNKYKGSLI